MVTNMAEMLSHATSFKAFGIINHTNPIRHHGDITA